MDYDDFFRQATGLQTAPYPYQRRLALELARLAGRPNRSWQNCGSGAGLALQAEGESRFRYATTFGLLSSDAGARRTNVRRSSPLAWLDMLAVTAEWEHVAEKRGLKQYNPPLVPDGWAGQHAIEGPPLQYICLWAVRSAPIGYYGRSETPS
jgi:hypothetical protein